MKNILLAALFLVAFSGLAAAQENYTVNATANVVIDITSLSLIQNQRTCERLNAVGSPNCTQAQACTAANAAGGVSCTPAQARASNARIYPATLAGREEWMQQEVVIPAVNDKRASIRGRYQERRCNAWATANATQRNTMCAAVNAVDSTVPATVAAGCDLSCS